jgi:type IV pilus assembly protein PilA
MAWALHCFDSVTARSTRGFTLIEMMIVVAIVGILATLAVVGYRKIVQTSHVTEAHNMVQSIRVAQEAYHAETQQYADISANLTGAWYPHPSQAPTGRQVTTWGAACATSACPTLDWSVLPLHVDGPVMFGYATRAGPSNSAPAALPSVMSSVTLPTASATDWYMVVAMCDVDGIGSPNTYVLTTSWSNQVFTFNEGQ